MYNSIITCTMKDWIDMYKCNTMNIMESATLQSGGRGGKGFNFPASHSRHTTVATQHTGGQEYKLAS